jgi:nucleotide-binding universal stress UspA family protein
MGTRGQGGIQRFLLGSTTDRVLRIGHLPVLAVPLRGFNDTTSAMGR